MLLIKKQTHDSVITGKRLSLCYIVFLTSLMSILCVVVQNCYLDFLGEGLTFFVDRLASLLSLLCSLARFDLANGSVRQPVQLHTDASLLVFDETLSQLHFAVANSSDAVMSVFYSPFLKHSQTFASINVRGLPLSACHCLAALFAKMCAFNSLMLQNACCRQGWI